MKSVSYLQNEQICLRAPEPSDVEMLYQLENDTSLWNLSNATVPFSHNILQRYVEQNTHDVFTDRQARFMISRIADGALLGAIDLTDFEPLHLRAEIGIVIFPDCQNQSYGSQAVHLLSDYSERFLHIHQLYARVPEDNAYSLRLFEKQGFQKSGILKDWLLNYESSQNVVILQKIFSL